MGKLLVDKYAGKAERIINLKTPSRLIPFKGDFPLLPLSRRKEWNKVLDTYMWVEDCPKWASRIMLDGSRMIEIEDGFKDYLSSKSISEENFIKKSNEEKANILFAFLDANSLTLASIDYSIDYTQL